MHVRFVVSACLAALVAASPAAFAQGDKPAAKKTATRPKAKLKHSAQKAVEEVTPVDDDPKIELTDADLEVAKQVYVGSIPCELGASVKVTPARRTGLFVVTTKGYKFLMHPVESRTGAIRLEDGRRGALWLQLGNKSMLMSQKLGQRLADECQSPQQVTFAEELKRHPRPSILDAPTTPMQEATAPGSAASAAAATATPAAGPVAPGAPAAASTSD